MMGSFARGALAAAILVGLAAPVLAEPGVRWEMTTKMTMAGMSMPGQSTTACLPKAATQDDMPSGIPDEQNCQVSNKRTVGSTTSFDIRCTGDEPMTGRVETTFHGPDHYTSVMTMTMDGEPMTMTSTARKIGGDCDAGAVRRQVAAAQNQAAGQLDQACADGVQRMEVALFDGTLPTIQCSPQRKAEFCDRLSTRDGYGVVSANNSLNAAAQACGTSVATLTAGLCRSAFDTADVAFLQASCPAEAAALAARECTGRSFTSVDARYRSLCVNQARSTSPAAAATPAGTRLVPGSDPTADVRDAVVEGGTQLLRGLFGN